METHPGPSSLRPRPGHLPPLTGVRLTRTTEERVEERVEATRNGDTTTTPEERIETTRDGKTATPEEGVDVDITERVPEELL